MCSVLPFAPLSGSFGSWASSHSAEQMETREYFEVQDVCRTYEGSKRVSRMSLLGERSLI
jgi:hypothetical protein